MPTPRDHPSAAPSTGVQGLQQALDHLAGGDALDQVEVTALVESTVLATYRRLTEVDDPSINAQVDLETNAVELYRLGESGERQPVSLPAPDFVRQAAMAVRRAVAVRLRDTANAEVLREATSRRGELVDSIVERLDGPVWWLRVGDHPAVLPPEEQMADEEMERNQHLKVVVIDVQRRHRAAVMVVSRSHPLLLRRLLAQEVPELAAGQIEIRAIAREAGRRSKVAVVPLVNGIDAQGACIGPRGVRHRAVVSELAGEQVQIIAWSDDPAELVARALAPATVLGVELDEETRTAHCTVPADHLSLAIGRSGENARLVARITGWRIDIGPPG